jgi:Cu(I)/Ag(I) efflux system membrane fusion protein
MKKKLKKNSLAFFLLAALAIIALSCNRPSKKQPASQSQPAQYTCPMHPQILSDHPGSCPICGMDLVKNSGGEHDTLQVPADLASLIKSPNGTVVSNMGIVRPAEKTMADSLNAPGVITYDTRRQNVVAARFGGRIEKLYLKYQFQPVSKGQLIAEIYSPELVTAQRELLYILKTDKSNEPLIQDAIQKLKLLGVTSGQVSTLMRTGHEYYRLPVYSPYSGYLTDPSASAPQAKNQPAGPVSSADESMGNDGGMGASANAGMSSGDNGAGVAGSPAPPGVSLLQEGAYVAAGQTLFSIVDPSRLWAEINISTVQAGGIANNTKAILIADDGSQTPGRIELIQPFYDQGATFIKVRISINNSSHRLRIGQLVKATIHGKDVPGLWIPQSALLDLGTRYVAFIKRNHAFVPVVVTRGAVVKDWVQIRSGLVSGDEIAANAQFLIDSESFIETKENNQ